MSRRASFWKTVVLSCAASVAFAAIAAWLLTANGLLALAGCVAGMTATLACLVAIAGVAVLLRDRADARSTQDWYARNANRAPTAGWSRRIGLRPLLGPALRPGDRVRVRSPDEIARTLDADGACRDLPFMEEMRTFAGRVCTVHRRVDKINDMRNKTGLRRMRDSVTLSGVRCSGAAHGGCQAECQIIWRTEWLARVPDGDDAQGPPGSPGPVPATDEAREPEEPGDRPFRCQMTRLWESSEPMAAWDPRADLRALWWGNVNPGAWLLALLTRLFSRIQAMRGGVGYPILPPAPSGGSGEPAPRAVFEAGDRVLVRSGPEVASTLVDSRNRGLWFDRDMIRYCGKPAVVKKRVVRLIHEATGMMVTFKTPCVMLEDVLGTGEFLRFCPQHEFILWRDVWLSPVPDARASGSRATTS